MATASRLVAELVEHGLLVRDDDRRVRIGVRMWELAMRASPTLSLREAVMPFLEDLHGVVGHHAQLGVLDGDEVLFVERLCAPGRVINYTRIAGRLPLHASSSGLVLLAHAPHDLPRTVLAGPLRRYTPETIATPERAAARPGRCPPPRLRLLPRAPARRRTGVAVPVTGPTGQVPRRSR